MSQQEIKIGIHLIGWIFISLSTACMYLSLEKSDSIETSFLLWIFIARLLGISGFLCGVASIFQGMWTHGTLLILSALVLPIISYAVHASI